MYLSYLVFAEVTPTVQFQERVNVRPTYRKGRKPVRVSYKDPRLRLLTLQVPPVSILSILYEAQKSVEDVAAIVLSSLPFELITCITVKPVRQIFTTHGDVLDCEIV